MENLSAFQTQIEQIQQHLGFTPEGFGRPANQSELGLYLFPHRPKLQWPESWGEIQETPALLQALERARQRACAGEDDFDELCAFLTDQLQRKLQFKEYSWYRYLPSEYRCPEFSLPPAWLCRQLQADDRGRVEAFQSQCSQGDRDLGKVSLDDPVAFGCFDARGHLVGMASFWFWADALADIGLLSSPHVRGQGVGTALVRALMQWAQAQAKLCQFRHLQQNIASAAVAHKLGFQKVFPVLFFAE